MVGGAQYGAGFFAGDEGRIGGCLNVYVGSFPLPLSSDSSDSITLSFSPRISPSSLSRSVRHPRSERRAVLC